MLARDGVAGILCLGGSLWFLALTRGLPQPALVPVGPAFYPRIVLAILAVLSALLVVTDLWGRRHQRLPRAARRAAPRNYRLVALVFAIFGAYVFLLPLAGFRLGTFLFVAALQATLERPAGRRWVVVVIVAAATALVTHTVFETYLSVLLPRGRWTGF